MAKETREIIRLTTFVPGTPESADAWNEALKRSGLRIKGSELRGADVKGTVKVEWFANDGAFGEAFSFGTVDKETMAVIDRAPGALVLHWPVDLLEGRLAIVAAIEHLRDAGALAVRIEQSKMGWDVATWLELMSADDPWAWHRAAVAFLGSEGSLQSCGMHAFSLPDVQMAGKGTALQELGTSLNVYQIAEDPLLLSGQTFSPDADTPRRVVERWPDTEYPGDHPCNNPYGVWRLGRPGSKARPQTELAPVFMPTLRAILLALEKQARSPLTQKQVEAVRDGATCMALKHIDAQKLERTRGYADLNPEFVWEQWKLVRPTDG